MLAGSRISRTFSILAMGVAALTANAAWAQAATGRVAPVQPAEINEEDRVVLRGNVPAQAKPANDVGPADPATPMRRIILLLNLRPGAQVELDALLAAQQNPQSPLYHQWLTPQQYGERFGISDEDLQVVKNWLTGHGFTIDEVAAGRRTINFSGNVRQVQETFRTQIRQYRVKGELHHANSSDPSIPRALSGLVAGVDTLHDFRKPMHSHFRKGTLPRASKGAVPEATFGNTHLLAPGDFATIYDTAPLLTAGIDGTGQNIAIVGRTNITLSDVQTFRSTFSLPVNDPQIILNGPDPGIVSTGEEGEAQLDVQWSGAVAPLATIEFVVSGSTMTTDGVDLSAQYIVNNNVVLGNSVMSTSFGQCEQNMGNTELNFYNATWQQAVMEGITAMVSSGDSGAAGCDDQSAGSGTIAAVSGLCSTPFNVCVGGSEFNEGNNPAQYWSPNNNPDFSSALSYIPEVVWNESGSAGFSGLHASGGGASIVYSKPAFQVAPGVPADGARDVPDVALTAAGHDGYIVCQADAGGDCSTGNVLIVSGTSASSPSFAGIMALIVQSSGTRQGNANNALYPIANAQYGASGTAVFHDVTSGNNTVPGVTGFNAGPGYDEATGLGSVDANLLAAVMSSSQASQFSVSAPANANAGVAFSITVTAQNMASATVPTYKGTVHFTSSDPGATLPADYTFVAADNGVHVFNGVSLVTLGSQSITATDTVSNTLTGSANVTVAPGPATHLSVAAPANTTAGVSFNFTVTAQDAGNNTATGFADTVHFTSSDAQAVLPANNTLSSGVRTFSATLKTSGSQSITASDTANLQLAGNSGVIAVATAAASKYSLTLPPTATINTPFTLRLVAQDAFNNTVKSYAGTAHFTTTDAAGGVVLPANYTFQPADNGQKTFANGATLQTAGAQSVTATDTLNAGITATVPITVTSDLPLTPQGRTIRIFRDTPSLVVASFTDADTNETGSNLSATIDWGDGTGVQAADAVVPEPNHVFNVMGHHSYAGKGTFAVKVTMTDSGGSIAVANSAASFFPRGFSF